MKENKKKNVFIRQVVSHYSQTPEILYEVPIRSILHPFLHSAN